MIPFKKDLTLVTHCNAEDFSQEDWNSLLGSSIPMMSWEWFVGMEKSGVISKESDFEPAHLAILRKKKPIAIVPLYLKSKVEAEWSAAGFLMQLARRTEEPPKKRLVGLIPFTPVPGYHFLLDPKENIQYLYNWILEFLEQHLPHPDSLLQLEHVDLNQNILIETLNCRKWIKEKSYTYRWKNQNFNSFEEFLKTFPAKRRNKIKREITACADLGISIQALKGDQITQEVMKMVFLCYQANHQKHYGHSGSLEWPFWEFLLKNYLSFLLIVVAKKNNKILGMNLFVEGKDGLFGRWWGALEDLPFLHFNTCYYFPIKYAIQKGLKFIDPGYQGKFKRWRGFERFNDISFHFTTNEKLHKFLRTVFPLLQNREED